MVVGSATRQWKKALKMGLLIFRRGFNTSKCKTMAKMAVARVKLLRNKREVVIKQMKRDIAMLLESGQDATARIRVEHVIREQNIMAANELIELFCELVVSRLSIMAKQRECPADLKEGIASLLFAGPRCSDIPELLSIRDIFQKKYGSDFVSAATDLRPNAGVNRSLIEKLSVKTPSGEAKLKVLKDIAKEYQVQWDTTESEMELLKPPEERIVGPNRFVSATSLPLNSVPLKSPKPDKAVNGSKSCTRSFHDLAAAAGVAAEKALAAAEAATVLANMEKQMPAARGSVNYDNTSVSRYSTGKFMPGSQTEYSTSYQSDDDHRNTNMNKDSGKVFRRQSYNCQRAYSAIKYDEYADYDEEIEMEEPPIRRQTREINRRHSYNLPPARSDVRYDEYDDDDDDRADEPGHATRVAPPDPDLLPPERLAPQAPPVRRVHPKLPDYDTLAARFEALKHQNKSQPKH